MAGVWLVELLWVCWVCSGFYFVFFILGFWFRFPAFGSDLGGVWVGVGWLDLGPVVVIFSDGLGDLLRWV